MMEKSVRFGALFTLSVCLASWVAFRAGMWSLIRRDPTIADSVEWWLTDIEIHTLSLRIGLDVLILPLLLSFAAVQTFRSMDRRGGIFLLCAAGALFLLCLGVVYYPALIMSGRSLPLTDLSLTTETTLLSIAFAAVLCIFGIMGRVARRRESDA